MAVEPEVADEVGELRIGWAVQTCPLVPHVDGLEVGVLVGLGDHGVVIFQHLQHLLDVSDDGEGRVLSSDALCDHVLENVSVLTHRFMRMRVGGFL